MDPDRFITTYKKEFVSHFSEGDEKEQSAPKFLIEECTPRPIFYYQNPNENCNWQSCTYQTSMPQKYPYIQEALKSHHPPELVSLNRDYHKKTNQFGYCSMQRTAPTDVSEILGDCYMAACEPQKYKELKEAKVMEILPKEEIKLTHHVQPKHNAISGTDKQNREPVVLRDLTKGASVNRFPPMDGVTEYVDTISKIGRLYLHRK